ncbi:MAG: AarF/UbiB family protein, partial [Planctomycetes bacterium]|nr:AarF/UbiB family protein [Ideonella sp.]MCU0867856.1 AarF/UbiB family protein [Planctomycetota bacterium]
MLVETLGAARDLPRLHEIATVLARHGLGDLVRRAGLADALARAGRVVHWEHADELARLPPPVQVRRALEELGPTFVKLGQILASRVDLFDAEWTAEFAKLQSRVPPVPFDQLRPQLVEDLGADPETVFARFDDEPLAAASVAQAHRAQLKDGTEVVVKVRRPGVDEVIEADLRLLERAAAFAEEEWPVLKPYRPRQVVREFGRSLRRELDLAAEGRNAERIAANLAALPEVVIPRVHWTWTGPRLNVQDFVDGVPGEDLERIDREGFDRRLLAQRGARVIVKMIVEDGFFHADPHAGNVFYLPGNRIALIDFGMVGRLSPRRREELLRLLLALVERRADAVADVLLDWTGDANGARLTVLEDEIEVLVDRYHGAPLAQIDLGRMLLDVTGVLRSHHLALPPDLALLIKCFVSLEGMGRALDPQFNVAREALPLLRRVLRARYAPRELGRRGWRALVDSLGTLGRLPSDVAQLVRRARHGRVQVHIDIAELKETGERVDRAASRLAIALVIAALIIGSSIVMTVGGGPQLLGLPAFGLLGFVA